MQMTRCKLFLIYVLMLTLMSCGGGGGGGGGKDALDPITDAYEAKNAVGTVRDICNGVMGSLGNGSYTNQVVNGREGIGTATVTGSKSYDSTYGGSDSLTTTRTYNVTIVFDSFKTKTSDNSDITISGKVDYYYYDRMYTTGYGYSSSSSTSIESQSPVQITAKYQQDSERYFGIKDTITFSASASNSSILHGSCTVKKGVTYYF
jgi:hypothetical protein